MSLNRYGTRRDTSEPGILKALTKVGARYMLLNVFDVLVLFRGGLFLLECKTGKGRTTSSQDRLIALGWPLRLVRTPEEALRAIGALLILLLLATPAAAQTTTERAADWVSTGLVGVNVVADVVHDVRHHCVRNLILRNGLTIGAAELTKHLVHEDRPDHSDAKSFFSEHSALAMVNSGWSYSIGFSVAFGAGTGRLVAQKHHPADVMVGLAVGFAAAYWLPCTP